MASKTVTRSILEQCCSHSKQYRNNDATLCCAKNRRCDLFRVTSPALDIAVVVVDCKFPIITMHKTDGFRANESLRLKYLQTRKSYDRRWSSFTILQ